MELKELKDLLKVLRNSGVTSYNTPELSLVLSEEPPLKKTSKSETSDEPDIESEWEGMSDEEKLLWSAGQ